MINRGAHIVVNVMIKILETQISVPRPRALVLTYAALDFNFTSWMSPANLRVLQSEQSSGNIPGIAEQKDHFGHISPLSMVGDRKMVRRRRSWRDTLRNLASPTNERPPMRIRSLTSPRQYKSGRPANDHYRMQYGDVNAEEAGSMADEEDSADIIQEIRREEDMPLEARVRFNPTISQIEAPKLLQEGYDSSGKSVEAPLGTRLTMTSRTGYFQDRIISPSMVGLVPSMFRVTCLPCSSCTANCFRVT